jgi:MSHA biogenesis protein MshJ
MARFAKWSAYLEARTPRERLLLLITVLVAIFLLGYLVWLGPELDRRTDLQEQQRKLSQQTAQLQAQIEQLGSALNKDPDLVNRQRLSQARQQSGELDARMRRLQDRMIAPDLMPEVLNEMLRDLPLKLVKLQKKAPEIELDLETAGVPRLYRHSMRLELEGSFHDTLDYLEKLERLPWRLSWKGIDIQMLRYPTARIVLDLYTLSFEEDWLGV